MAGEVVRVNDFFHCNKVLFYVKIKRLLVQFVTVAPCLPHVVLCEEGASPLPSL